jgi:hypothetical protein
VSVALLPRSKPSLNDLVSPQQKRRRDRHSDRAGCFQIHDKFELRRLLNGQIGWFCTTKDFVNEANDKAIT